jgi:hypothetical protein
MECRRRLSALPAVFADQVEKTKSTFLFVQICLKQDLKKKLGAVSEKKVGHLVVEQGLFYASLPLRELD